MKARAKTNDSESRPNLAPVDSLPFDSVAGSAQGAQAILRAMIEGSNELVSILDANGHFLYVGPSTRRILGYELEDLLGRDAFAYVHPDDVEALAERFREGMSRPGLTPTGEYRYRCADDSWRVLESIGTNLLDDPSIRVFVVNSRDVTDRRRTEETLAEHRRLLRAKSAELEMLYRTAPVGLGLLDTELCFLQLNNRLAAIHGLPPSGHIGRSLREICPQMADELEPIYRSVLASGEAALGVEVRCATPAMAGIEKDWLVSCYRFDDRSGQPVGVNTVVQDITELKDAERALARIRDELESRVTERTAALQATNAALISQAEERQRAEESLRRSEERYRHLVENITDVIFAIDVDGRLNYASPMVAGVLGYTPAELVGRAVAEFVHVEDFSTVVASFRRVLKGQSEAAEFRVLDKLGQVHWLRSHSQPLVEGGRIVGLLGVMTDVTERHLAAMQARRQLSEMAHVQRLTTAGEMTAEIAHQINQPLAAIVNFAGGLATRLRSGEFDAAAMQDVAARISGEAHRAGQVIRRLRDFLRKGESVPKECDLNQLVGNVYGAIEEDFRREGIEVLLALDAGIPLAKLDGILVEQVIMNLLRNAHEAMSGDGGKNHRLELATQSIDAGVQLRVRDSGVGLPHGREDQVFEAFFTTKPEGLGLGLSVSKSIIEAGGGRLWAERNGDRGTTFAFTLPLRPPVA